MSYRLIVVGKTGDGKSSTCNTLVGGQRFKADDCASAVTTSCQAEKNDDMGLTIVDTPGLCDSEAPLRERALEIQRSVLEICEEPHAFLLVFKMGRITNDDKMTIHLLSIIFGDEVFDHSIVVLTHGCNSCRRTGSTDDELSQSCDEYDELNDNEEEDKALASFCSKNFVLEDLVTRCNGRVIRIENAVERQCSIHTTKKLFGKLIRYVQSVSNDRKTVFKNNYLNTHYQTLKNEIEQYDNLQKEIENLQRTLFKKLEKARAEERQRVMKEEAERKERKEREQKEKEEKKKKKTEEKEIEKRRREEQEKIIREREERDKREMAEREEREKREREEREEKEKREREEREEREKREREKRERQEKEEREKRERQEREEREKRESEERKKRKKRERQEREEREKRKREKKEREEREEREKKEREEREKKEREERERKEMTKMITVATSTISGMAVGGFGGIAGADLLGKSISVGAVVGGPVGALVGLGIGAAVVGTVYSRKQKKN